MNTVTERAERWLYDSGDDTDELQEAAAIIRELMAKNGRLQQRITMYSLMINGRYGAHS